MGASKRPLPPVSRPGDMKITAGEISMLATTLPPLAESGEPNLALATELVTDLLMHFQYVRVLLYDTVDKNPFGVVHPRSAAEQKQDSIVRTLPFPKYLRGLVTTINEGSPQQKLALLCEFYSQSFEDHITWPETSSLLRAHSRAPQDVLQVVNADFHELAALKRSEAMQVVRHGRSYEPMLSLTECEELLATYEASLDVRIDPKAMIKDVRRFQLADSQTLAASLEA